jgi:hypothetical protein
MIAVSDTTALTTLLKCGFDSLLPDLFGTVLIPSAVARELRAFHEAVPEWCIVRDVPEGDLLDRLRARVDVGEAEAIALAVSAHADVILLDDKKGRRQAEALGLTCLALPAVLAAARRNGLISSLTDAFATLASRGRYRVAETAALVLLRSVGEA